MIITKRNIGLYLSTEPTGGGTYQYVLSMIKALEVIDPIEFIITVFYFDSRWEVDIPKQFQRIRVNKSFFDKVRIKIYRLLDNTPEGWRYAGHFLNTVKAINNSKCDIIICPGQDDIAYQTNKQSIATIHDLMHRYESHFDEYKHGEYERREIHYSAMARYSTIILVDSITSKQQVIESYKVEDNKVFVLPFVPPYYLTNCNNIDVISKYHLPKKYIFYPAQFWEHKNHISLFKAIEILKNDGLEIALVLVGSKKNNYLNSIREIKNLGLVNQVHILGYVPNDDMYSLYKHAVAMTYVSLVGPTNIPPMEALLTGCPLICSNAYAMPEQVGDAALLVDPKDPNDIAQKIKLIWLDESLRVDLIKKGYQRTKIYGQNDFNKLIVNLIERVIPKNVQ